MNIEKNYAEIFEELVQGTQDYILGNGLRAMVLGISGGIDSTVVAAICHEVSKRTDIPLIGRSLPTKFNKEGETSAADLVGKTFCTDYKKVDIHLAYCALRTGFNSEEISAGHPEKYPIANGNIQARLRMIYLYNLASIHGGLVMDTDNLTENNLGYFTIHGDVGDFNPIGGLWKTEVFELAIWLCSHYGEECDQCSAILKSLELKPTAGLGITDSDLEEIGANNWFQVDTILKDILRWKFWNETCSWKDREHPLEDYLKEHKLKNIPYEVIERVATRHFRSEFKRKQLPIKL